MNNPLNKTDPSGFFFSKLWKEIKPFIGTIVAIVVTIVCPVCGPIVAGMIGGAVGAAVNGGNILMGAAFGAFSGAAGGIGGIGGFVTRGMIGGMQTAMAGGKFGSGFAAAGIGGMGGGSGWTGFVQSSVLGGVASEITGGKFKNGAASAAFMYAVGQGVKKYGAGGGPADLTREGKLGPERFDAETQAKIKHEIELAVDVTKANETGFDSSGDAAVYLREKIQSIAEKYDIEIGAYIPKVNGRYVIADVQTSFHNHTVSSMTPRLRTDWFHTHQSTIKNNFFSDGDLSFTRNSGSTGYMSGRGGLYRFRGFDYGVEKVQANGRYPVNVNNYFEKYNSTSGAWDPSDIVLR